MKEAQLEFDRLAALIAQPGNDYGIIAEQIQIPKFVLHAPWGVDIKNKRLPDYYGTGKKNNRDFVRAFDMKLNDSKMSRRYDHLDSVIENFSDLNTPVWIEEWVAKVGEAKQTKEGGIHTIDLLLTDNTQYVTFRCTGDVTMIERLETIARRLKRDETRNFKFVGLGLLADWESVEEGSQQKMPVVDVKLWGVHDTIHRPLSRIDEYDQITLERDAKPIYC
jgi:hypothetical protein